MLKIELNIPIDLYCLTVNYNRKDTVVGIYKITSPTGKINIGQSIDIENRFSAHYRKYKCKDQTLLYNSLKKHGVENHKFEIIHIVEVSELTKSEIKGELNRLEVYYIKKFNSFYDDNKEFGLNLTRGGDSRETSEYTKSKISKTLTGRKASEEARENQRNAIKKRGGVWNKGKSGEQHNRYGVKQTPEHIEKRTAKNKGRKMSEESIQKSIETRKKNYEEKIKNGYMPRSEIRKRKREEKLKYGYVRPKKIISEETRKKQSEARLGKKLSPESIIKREETRKIIRQERLTMIF